MEQSDAMLISSLKQYIKVPDEISALKDVRIQHIFSMACNVFQSLKVDYSDLKQITKAQRFRSMTKLTQTINQEMDTAFDLNDIMNPTLPFIRKLLLAFISKLGAAQGQRNKAIMNKKIEGNQGGGQKQMLKRWLNTQYICPQLRTNNKIKYQPHLLKIQLKKDIFKRNLGSQLAGLPTNANAILRNTMMKQTMERKKRQAEEGITRKAQQQNDRNVNRIVKNNAQDWQKADLTVKKLKKQLLKDEEQQKQNNDKKQMSVYQNQVSKIAEELKKLKGVQDKKSEAQTKSKISEVDSIEEMNPWLKIKKQCQNQQMQLERHLKQILNAISQARQNIAEKQQLKQKMQDQIALYQERAAAEREARAGIKKQAEKQKLLLDTLQGDTDIVKQVQQVQQQVKYLEKQAEKQVVSLQNQIQNTKKQGEQKLQILKDLKIRLNKIQTDYAKVCQQIQDKTQIKSKVKITKSGISRLYYSKKISQMETRWRQTQKQSKKIIQNVSKIRQDIRRTVYLAQRVQTQIQNSANTSKVRTQAQNGTFKQIFQRCKKTFARTIKCIQQVNETKNQIQQYEMKVHTLAGKDYKQNIKKLQIALEQLKKEIKENTNKK